MMTKVNDAYRAQDLAALRQLADAQPEAAHGAGTAHPPKTRVQVLAEIQAEVATVEELAVMLEHETRRTG